MRAIDDDLDKSLELFFRCNSTLANEGTLYNVDCMLALELAYTPSFITRRDDATMQCPKTMKNNSGFPGVSQKEERSWFSVGGFGMDTSNFDLNACSRVSKI